ncbi:MAG: uroporphyrinogen decarboxylase family protein [Vicinamibacterales bacterium]
MSAGRFMAAVRGESQGVPPIWLMRQAGRYQARYQAMRRQHSFESLCRIPELAAEAAMNAIEDFDFDAAIVFSDLLFPLEALGFGLRYDAGPPALSAKLTPPMIGTLRPWQDAAPRLRFQADAVAATRARLDPGTGLIGFVGGPWTLFVYACEGSHAGALTVSKSNPALYQAFAASIVPLLTESIRMQLEAGADVVMVLDTAAGELPPSCFGGPVARDLAALASAFPGRTGYYAKASHPDQLASPAFANAPWAGVGVDSRWSLAPLLAGPRRGFIQGNFDPALMLMPAQELRRAMHSWLAPIRALSASERAGWICGLGHGVLPGTPEDNVRLFVHEVREACA